MKKVAENIIFQLGSAFLALGLLSVTALPLIIRSLDFIITPTAFTFMFVAFLFYVIGAILYALSFGYYKSQISWIFKLTILYCLFQIFVRIN